MNRAPAPEDLSPTEEVVEQNSGAAEFASRRGRETGAIISYRAVSRTPMGVCPTALQVVDRTRFVSVLQCMAVSLVSNEVSDLCIGKPALKSLPLSAAAVGDALLALRRGGEPHLAVLAADRAAPEKRAVVGRLCVADVLCYLCSDGNLASPSAALERPVSALLPKGACLVRRVEPQFRYSSVLPWVDELVPKTPSFLPCSKIIFGIFDLFFCCLIRSVSEALDLILDGAQSLVVPIGSVGRKKLAAAEFCWLTQEDFVRYFLNSIALFSPVPALSIDALGLVRSADALAIRHDEPGLSLLPLVRRALSDQTAVAVVTDDGRLLGEISPAALSACDETVAVAAGIATLTAGDLMAFIDYYGSPSESLVRAIKAGLKEKGLQEMLELMEDELSSFSNSSSSASSSSSDDESSGGRRLRKLRSRSFSIGRRSEEPEVCHPGSSLVAVMVQALAHRVSYLWVVDEDDYGLMGIVTFADILRVFREQLQQSSL
ncbi:hypothetical protein B296_00032821 [Ensete ventricosum]|uniref:CBS domain-containing protein n=1 Tax=Ensete ventricosum TaxID=4639 RepID=A0A426Y655_ENSVE|nr:hypothetical protein B296_00032821 [Ensete ventricosum]